MVEFLSGSLTLYLFNNFQQIWVNQENTIGFQTPVTIFVCYQTARRWLPEVPSTGIQQEILFQNITSKQHAWETTSELPGVSGKFVTNAGGGKPIQKLRWKFTQKSWKTLKADPTGFQVSLEEDGNLYTTGQLFYPLNNGVVKVAFDIGDASVNLRGALEIYSSQRLLLRFKGRRE
ncbi:MAG: hypothetical protein QXF82_11050 [Nitrososphaeria archaeon]